MKQFLRKALVWSARIFAVLVVLLILFYAEEDWRGARDWAACQRDLATRGESLDLRQLAPPARLEEDLSKVPIYAEMYQKNIPDNARLRQLKIDLGVTDLAKVPAIGHYLKGEPTDLVAWQEFYRSEPKSHLPQTPDTPAQDILQALSQFDPDLSEIDTAVSNPGAYFPVDYKNPEASPLSPVTSMLQIARLLSLKAAAHLDNHETDLAEKDYLFSFRLNQPLTKDCGLVKYLVMTGVRAIDESILWEGLHRHAWSDAQLHEMESALAATDMLALAANTLRTERASGLQTFQIARSKPNSLRGLSTDNLSFFF